jgi:hypothetical protein
LRINEVDEDIHRWESRQSISFMHSDCSLNMGIVVFLCRLVGFEVLIQLVEIHLYLRSS